MLNKNGFRVDGVFVGKFWSNQALICYLLTIKLRSHLKLKKNKKQSVIYLK